MTDFLAVLNDPTHWHWFVLAIILVTIEVVAPGSFFLWMGVGAAVTGLAMLLAPDLAFPWQLLIFCLAALAGLLIGRHFFRKTSETEENFGLNERGQQMVGKTYVAAENFVGSRGKIKVGDSLWIASGFDAKKGDTVRVTAVNGAAAEVERADG
jgi:inner membrane protein